MTLRLRAGQDAQLPELVDFAEITEIELRVLRRMKEYTLGDHGSVFHGTGVDFVGLRDWQAGDRMSSIDWPQSTLTRNYFQNMICGACDRSSKAVQHNATEKIACFEVVSLPRTGRAASGLVPKRDEQRIRERGIAR